MRIELYYRRALRLLSVLSDGHSSRTRFANNNTLHCRNTIVENEPTFAHCSIALSVERLPASCNLLHALAVLSTRAALIAYCCLGHAVDPR
jgi:hypothetical protein